MDAKRADMIETNRAQAEYYDSIDGGGVSSNGNFATSLWWKMRYRAMASVSDEARALVDQRQREWLGDLSGKKVLELGVGRGSPFSHQMADTAGEYHAIDLSEAEIAHLQRRLGDAPNRHFHVDDFLSDAWTETGFDLIVARSVLHHFQHMEILVDTLEAKLAPEGRIISYDPLQTWFPLRVLRAAYRPFQSDAEWEFPFTKHTLELLESRFELLDRFGVFGRGKWALIVGMVSPGIAKRHGDAWFSSDLLRKQSRREVLSCMHVSYHLKKRA